MAENYICLTARRLCGRQFAVRVCARPRTQTRSAVFLVLVLFYSYLTKPTNAELTRTYTERIINNSFITCVPARSCPQTRSSSFRSRRAPGEVQTGPPTCRGVRGDYPPSPRSACALALRPSRPRVAFRFQYVVLNSATCDAILTAWPPATTEAAEAGRVTGAEHASVSVAHARQTAVHYPRPRRPEDMHQEYRLLVFVGLTR